jgi:hypothetical protein
MEEKSAYGTLEVPTVFNQIIVFGVFVGYYSDINRSHLQERLRRLFLYEKDAKAYMARLTKSDAEAGVTDRFFYTEQLTVRTNAN